MHSKPSLIIFLILCGCAGIDAPVLHEHNDAIQECEYSFEAPVYSRTEQRSFFYHVGPNEGCTVYSFASAAPAQLTRDCYNWLRQSYDCEQFLARWEICNACFHYWYMETDR